MRVSVLLLAVAGITACSSSGEPSVFPDRNDGGVQAAEAELAAVVSAESNGWDCDVRLLGEVDGASFVWAECSGQHGGAMAPMGGFSVPMRIDDAGIAQPGDGALYSDGVRRLFPGDIADAILRDPDSLRPSAG